MSTGKSSTPLGKVRGLGPSGEDSSLGGLTLQRRTCTMIPMSNSSNYTITIAGQTVGTYSKSLRAAEVAVGRFSLDAEIGARVIIWKGPNPVQAGRIVAFGWITDDEAERRRQMADASARFERDQAQARRILGIGS